VRQAVYVSGQRSQNPQLSPIGYQPAASGNTAAPQYNTQSPGHPRSIAQQIYSRNDKDGADVSKEEYERLVRDLDYFKTYLARYNMCLECPTCDNLPQLSAPKG
jgi:hypothetical protein